jgi:serine/threonine protein phosphatase PrpC
MTDHYQMLGVAPTASTAEIRQAYARLARERHPDRFTDPAEKQRAQSALQDITTAFNELVNPRSRQEYDGARHKPVPRTPEEIASDAFERAQPLLEGGRLDEAVTLLRTAVHHAPDQAPYHAALGRAPGPRSGNPARPAERGGLRRPGGGARPAGAEAARAEGDGDGAAPRPPRRAPRPPRRRARPGPAVNAMRVGCEARTDVGRKRKGNEDSLFLNPEQKLYVVADGMGGHAAGEIASRVAVDAINEFVTLTGGNEEITWPFGLDDTISYEGNRLKTAIRHANRRVLEATRESPEYEGMATTVAAVLVDGDTAHIAHVGDSRIYLWSGGGISQLTSDHSWVNEQIQSGVISPEQARNHPLRNVVTRALGGRSDLVVDIQSRRMEPGDVLLLCSDGLTTMIGDEDIARIIADAAGDVARAATALVDEANERGGDDNITVVLLKFEE